MADIDPAVLRRLADAVNAKGHGGNAVVETAEYVRYVTSHLDALVALTEQAAADRAAVERVRALHQPSTLWKYDDVNGVWVTDDDGEQVEILKYCQGCTPDDAIDDAYECAVHDGDSRFVDWPCDTIRALGATS